MRFRVICPLVFLLTCALGLLGGQPSSTHGPAHGALVLQGGVGDNRAIASAFVALAGGPASHIVVIPTASVFDAGPPGMATSLARRMRESLGVEEATVLHALDRATTDSDSFVEPLRKATGVWLLGGMPERLVQAYLNTKTERAIKELLDRGGVVGGESAGAMIQGSWLDTTDSESFTPAIQALIRAHSTGAGFGLLTHSAIFPHFDSRGPEAAVRQSAAHPDQLAIGIDEETALVVRGNQAEVVGRGTVSLYDGAGRGAPNVVILEPGERYDLAARRRLAAQATTGPAYRLVWADEFDRPGRPDPANWTYETGFVRNEEAQWYQAENARVEDGLLVIEGRRERKPNPGYQAGATDWKRSREFAQYTSSSLTTRGLHSWQYGRLEMRARIDTRPGLWPAFWTLGVSGGWPRCGEVDIMEAYAGTLLANAAWGSAQRGRAVWADTRTPIGSLGTDWSSRFHVWRMDWDERRIRLFVDDRLLNEVDLAATVNGDGTSINPFRQPHYVLVNLAIGGTQGGDPSETVFPARYEIDYIRVYQAPADERD